MTEALYIYIFFKFSFILPVSLFLLPIILLSFLYFFLLSFLGSFFVGIDSAANGRFSTGAGYVASFSTQMTQHPKTDRICFARTVTNTARHASSCK